MSKTPAPIVSTPEDAEKEFEAQVELMNKEESPLELGLSYDPVSLAAIEQIERTHISPGTQLDDNWPWRSWGGLAEQFMNKARVAKSDNIRYCCIVCFEFASSLFKNKVKTMNPMRALFDLFDLHRGRMAQANADPTHRHNQQIIENTQRIFREECYVFFNREFMGRR